MKKHLLAVALAAVSLTSVAAQAATGIRFSEGIGYYVAVDTRLFNVGGVYNGLANPNANRLTFLFDHGDHFHSIGSYSLTGPAPGTVLDTNANNRIPETYTYSGPGGAVVPDNDLIQLVPGTGMWAGTRVAQSGGEYGYLGVASIQTLEALGGSPSGNPAPVNPFMSSGNRWSAEFQGVTVGLKLVSATAGLKVGTTGDMDIFDTGDTFTLGDSRSFEFMPTFYVDGGAAMGTYTAEFMLVNLGSNTNVRNGGRFFIDFYNPVPEPSTWALMAAGVALVGFTLRGRTRAGAA
ncbi:MAG: all3515 family Zur-repressed PEP-CTERM protein [Burkholderiales bacterium]|jgi:hypothetical protein|nr:all3515 family Zur-repressed PEP-CTERM protein [Burkholderiales bacterium]